jgi:hypothetical protein
MPKQFRYFFLLFQKTIYLKPVFLQDLARVRGEVLSNYDKAASLLLRSLQLERFEKERLQWFFWENFVSSAILAFIRAFGKRSYVCQMP